MEGRREREREGRGNGKGRQGERGGRGEFRRKHTRMLRVIILWVTCLIFFIVIGLLKFHQLKKSLL